MKSKNLLIPWMFKRIDSQELREFSCHLFIDKLPKWLHCKQVKQIENISDNS